MKDGPAEVRGSSSSVSELLSVSGFNVLLAFVHERAVESRIKMRFGSPNLWKG